MNARQTSLLGAIVVLFLLNCLSICLYFYPLTENRSPLTEPTSHLTERRSNLAGDRHHPARPRRLKRWPSLPSYLPWTQQPRPPVNSCEAYFGNGFTRRVDLLPSSPGGGGGGWFRCFYSETLRSSVCEGGRLRMVPERIRASRGGERLEEVVGREEDEELPEFEDGAFEVEAGAVDLGLRYRYGRGGKLLKGDLLDMYVPKGDVDRHRMGELLGSIRVVEAGDFHCDQWVEEPTLLVIRYEYANMFHTVTDWYSAYVSSRVTGLPYRPHLVFVDGHCKTQLEETWDALFSSLRHAKNFSGSVCFRHAIFSPLGYETPLFKGLSEEIDCHGAPAHDLQRNADDQKTARLHEFGEMIKSSFGLSTSEHHNMISASGYNVLFVRREDYLAHPRHRGKVESRLSNEQEVFESVRIWASNHLDCKINVINGLFAHMPMKEQVEAIRDASVIIGAHGAGLTHTVSALPKTVILEIISEKFRRPHFELIAQWKGLEYHAINLRGSYAAPSVVIKKLGNIMRSLNC
ncbi:beta-1,2-xylosyltransferase-like [Punica granatum]|uniref:Beta-1,2-xylosyltransferase-like n=1 Tax=Punica granatum TaxID=22663 RepID=A0A6P8C1K6_PUNGR|nr:beta-1,2-xylosyltransferase-like [Punica granatum]